VYKYHARQQREKRWLRNIQSSVRNIRWQTLCASV